MSQIVLAWVLANVGSGMPDVGLPGYQPGGGRPDNTLPGGGAHPWFPGHRPDRPDQSLPGSGAHPGNRPPGSRPVLPTHPIYKPGAPVPPGTSPGAGLWVVAYVPGKGFQWTAITPGVPEKPQPPTVPTDPANPDNTLPSVPVDPDNPTAPPVVDNTLPPEGTAPPPA